ncbi:hypothetical protein BDN70DRAFT_874408, partial [Pholiota conissans]
MPLSLDVDIDAGTALDIPRGVIREMLMKEDADVVRRCHSLRVVSSDLVITDVFDAFVEHNLSNFNPLRPHASPLRSIHVVQTSTSRVRLAFPSDLDAVSPNLVALRVQSAGVSAYPHWHLQNVFLDGTHLSYHNHHHLFMKTCTKRLVLHRVTIPGGLPYVRRLIDPKTSTVLSLALSELRCIGPQREHQNLFAMFFTLTLYHNLQELELCALPPSAVAGLIESLRPPIPLVFTELRKLTLRAVHIPSRDMVLALAQSFPALREIELENTLEATSILVQEVWTVGAVQGVWPEVDRFVVNGESVRRR